MAEYNLDERDRFRSKKEYCLCGKTSYDKRTAQTMKNYIESEGRVKQIRIYCCEYSDTWHLTHKYGKRDE